MGTRCRQVGTRCRKVGNRCRQVGICLVWLAPGAGKWVFLVGICWEYLLLYWQVWVCGGYVLVFLVDISAPVLAGRGMWWVFLVDIFAPGLADLGMWWVFAGYV